MNFNRIITAVIGLPLVIAVFVFGNTYVIDIFFAVVALMSMHEYLDSFKEKAKPVYWVRIFGVCINCSNTCNSKKICINYDRNNNTIYGVNSFRTRSVN